FSLCLCGKEKLRKRTPQETQKTQRLHRKYFKAGRLQTCHEAQQLKTISLKHFECFGCLTAASDTQNITAHLPEVYDCRGGGLYSDHALDRLGKDQYEYIFF